MQGWSTVWNYIIVPSPQIGFPQVSRELQPGIYWDLILEISSTYMNNPILLDRPTVQSKNHYFWYIYFTFLASVPLHLLLSQVTGDQPTVLSFKQTNVYIQKHTNFDLIPFVSFIVFKCLLIYCRYLFFMPQTHKRYDSHDLKLLNDAKVNILLLFFFSVVHLFYFFYLLTFFTFLIWVKQ